MKVLLDTSVLVAAFWGDHPDHAASVKLYRSLSSKQGFCAAHSLAEVFSIMTRLPVKPAIPPEQALLFVNNIDERLTVVALQASEYLLTIRALAERGLGRSLVYDALISRSAQKAKVDALITWDVADFQRIAPEFADRIRTP
jgi:predicted nucleic acid-binding protein